MSYEGYVQVLCANGHYHSFDENYDSDETVECPDCGANIVWRNRVDDTNGESYGKVPMGVLEVLREVREVTKEVIDGRHVQTTRVVAGVYRIPTPEETKKLRTYCSEDSDYPVYLVGGKEADFSKFR